MNRDLGCNTADIQMIDQAICKVARAMISVFQSTTTLEIRKRALEAINSGDEAAYRAWCAILESARSLQSADAAK